MSYFENYRWQHREEKLANHQVLREAVAKKARLGKVLAPKKEETIEMEVRLSMETRRRGLIWV